MPEICLSTIVSTYSLLLHLRPQNTEANTWPTIHPRRPEGPPLQGAPDPTRETDRVSKKSKRKLTDRQERRRIEGLRILARIIARHYLANPHLYPNGAAGDRSQSAKEEGAA